MSKHETMKLVVDGKVCDIDKGIIDLVILFNELGITTSWSCEGGEENGTYTKAYIIFKHLDEYANFIQKLWKKKYLFTGNLYLSFTNKASMVYDLLEKCEQRIFIQPSSNTTDARISYVVRFNEDTKNKLVTALTEYKKDNKEEAKNV